MSEAGAVVSEARMRRSGSKVWRGLAAVAGVMALTAMVFAQAAITPDTVTFLGHVVTMAPLEPPGNNGASGGVGTVVLRVEVGTDGTVSSTKVVSGPADLVPAAVACAKQWKFKPFKQNGKKVPADGDLSFRFGQVSGTEASAAQIAAADRAAQAEAAREAQAAAQAQAAQAQAAQAAEGSKAAGQPRNAAGRAAGTAPQGAAPEGEAATTFDAAWKKCAQGVTQHVQDSGVLAACKQAAYLASAMPPGSAYLEKRSAFVYAATAYANAGDFKRGQAYAEQAVELANQERHKEPGDGEVYSTLSRIELMQGDFEDADVSMTSAELYDRKSIEWAKKKSAESVAAYTQALQEDLRFHSLILRGLKRKHDAKKKLKEADALNP